MDVGVLLIRVVVGPLLAGHGVQKLFGWFGGVGVAGTGGAFTQLGYRHGPAMAMLAGLSELAAGTGLAVGLLTPLAGAATIGTMVNAILVVHRKNGPWAQNGGYEYPLVVAVAAAGIALAGPGAFSVDALIGWRWPVPWGPAAIGLGLVAGAAAMLGRRRVS
jgi:putative oxidoreductase